MENTILAKLNIQITPEISKILKDPENVKILKNPPYQIQTLMRIINNVPEANELLHEFLHTYIANSKATDVLQLKNNINDTTTDENLEQATTMLAEMQSIMSSDKSIENDSKIKKLVEDLEPQQIEYEKISISNDIKDVSDEVLKIMINAGADASLAANIKQKKNDQIWEKARQPFEHAKMCINAIKKKAATPSTAPNQYDRVMEDFKLWSDLENCGDLFMSSLIDVVGAIDGASISAKKTSTPKKLKLVQAKLNPGSDNDPTGGPSYRKKKAGDSYLLYYPLPKIGSGATTASKVVLPLTTDQDVTFSSFGRHEREFVYAEKEIKDTKGATTKKATDLITASDRHPIIGDDLQNLRDVADELILLIDDFLANEFLASKIIKAKLMTGGVGPLDDLKRFLSLTLAIKYAEGIKEYTEKKLQKLQEKIRNLVNKYTSKQFSSTSLQQVPSSQNVLVKPLFSLLMYDIGVITKEDEQLFSVCSDAGLPAYAALAVYLTRDSNDIQSIIQNYATTNISPHTVLGLKKRADLVKFKKNWGITTLEQMQILARTRY